MHRYRQLFLVLGFVLSVLFAEGAVAGAAPGSSAGSSDLLGGQGCSTELFDGDRRLGPQTLSDLFPVAEQLAGYQRTGELTADQFLSKYWDPAVVPAGSFKYPPKSGYVLDGRGNPQRVQGQLDVGTLIDRYGSEGGNFLAPAGASYTSRALPPVNLVSDPADFCNYHVYVVTKPLPLSVHRSYYTVVRAAGVRYAIRGGARVAAAGRRMRDEGRCQLAAVRRVCAQRVSAAVTCTWLIK